MQAAHFEMGMLGTCSLCRAKERAEKAHSVSVNTNIFNMLWKCKIRSCFYYLLHSEQYHSLFGHVFGKHLKAEQHV